MRISNLFYMFLLSSFIVSCNSASSVNVISSNSIEEIVESSTTEKIIVIDDLINDVEKLIELSNEESIEDLYTIYLAKIETLLLDKAIIEPLNLYSSSVISKVANYNSLPIVYVGNVYHKIKDYILVDKFIYNNDFNKISNLSKSDKIAYLLENNYNLRSYYNIVEPNINITSLDPYSIINSFEFSMLSNCFDGLFKIDENGNCKPDMVESYFVSVDGLKYTFTLKDNLYFVDYNGNKHSQINADSFIYGFNHLLDTKYCGDLFNKVTNVENYMNSKCDFDKVGIKKIDNLTFTITLNQADNDFIYLLANNSLLPLDKDFYVSLGGEFGVLKYNEIKNTNRYTYGNINSLSNMLYSGAYYPKVIDNDSIELVRNNHYYDSEDVLIEKITYTKDSSNEIELFNKLENNEIDTLCLGPLVDETIINSELYKNYSRLHESKSLRYIGFNINRKTYALEERNIKSNKTTKQIEDYNKAISNNNFRKAILHSIDRERLISLNSTNIDLKNNFVLDYANDLSNDVITEYDDTISKDSTYKNVLSYYIEKQGMKIDFSKNDGIYNKEEALSYFNKAKEELPGVFDDVIVIDILTVANNELLNNQANVIKSSIEDSLGVNNIRVDIITVRNQYEYYLAGSSGAKCYDLYFDMSVNADFYSDINVLEKIFYNLIKNS